MKLYLNNIISFFLAVTILFSTMSFSMNIHHRINNMVDTSINNDAVVCDMEINSLSSNCDLITINKCCSTDIIIKEGDNELKKTTIKDYSDTVIFLYNYINLFEGLEENIIPFLNYDSPLIYRSSSN